MLTISMSSITRFMWTVHATVAFGGSPHVGHFLFYAFTSQTSLVVTIRLPHAIATNTSHASHACLMSLQDEDLFPFGFGEENDFALRTGQAGFKRVVVPSVYIYHHKTKSYTVSTVLNIGIAKHCLKSLNSVPVLWKGGWPSL